jgi:hypothetical protein
MELVAALLDLSCCLLECVNLASLIGNGIAWKRSQPYREARKEAKLHGTPPPPDDFWFQVFVFLTPITMTISGIVLYKWLR